MTATHSSSAWKWWLAAAGLVIAVAITGAMFLSRGSAHGHAEKEGAGEEKSPASASHSGVRVAVVRPKPGGIVRTTTQACNVEAFEHVDLYAEVSGYIARQYVDIGSQVAKGDILIELDVPELKADLQHQEASLEHSQAQVKQMEAKVRSARADVSAAEAAVVQAEADIQSKEAYLNYRNRQYRRITDLARSGAIEQKIQDEERERRDAAEAARDSARAAVATSKARLVAARAKVNEAEADLVAAENEVKVHEAEVVRARALVGFATIRAPFDGVVTHRAQFQGGFVRAASKGGNTPMLSIGRTDRMRVVLRIPDRDVPFVHLGEKAQLQLDALPGKLFEAKVMRYAYSEDQQTRTMRCEVDIDNKVEDRPGSGDTTKSDKQSESPTGEIKDGMFGYVTIILHEGSPSSFTIPASSLVGSTEKGTGHVYVIRDNKAYLTEVTINSEDGINLEVSHGLEPDDLVVTNPQGPMGNGVSVTITSNSQEGPNKGAKKAGKVEEGHP